MNPFKVVILLVLFVGTQLQAQKQKTKISGTITTIYDAPIENVSISNALNTFQTQSDAQGVYELNNLKAGEVKLVFSKTGYKTKTVVIYVIENQNNTVPNIQLYEGNELLQEVVVIGERKNKFSRKESAYVSKLPLKDLENAQVYSAITSELLESQIATTFNDALKNTTGIDKLWESTGRAGDGAGYYSLRGFDVQPTLVNGVPGLTNGSLDPSNIERIEVLKGPSATLFGSTVTSYGGLINTVTKKPYEGFGGNISYTAGSFGLNRLTADFNTKVNQSKSIYFRINTSYHNEKSLQDAGFRNSFFVAPSLSYRASDKLTFAFSAEISQSEQTNPQNLFLRRFSKMPTKNIEELGLNNNLSFTSDNITIKNPTMNYRIEAEYKMGNSWNSQTILSRSSSKTQGYYTYLYDLGVDPSADLFSRYISYQNATALTTDIQQNFIGDFKLGKMRNRIVAGLDYFNRTSTDNSSDYAFYGSVRANGTAIWDNPFTPNVVEQQLPLTTAGYENALQGSLNSAINTESHVYSTYVSNVFNPLPSLAIMASLRLDHFREEGSIATPDDDYKQTAFSPKFGVVFQPILDKLSVFANFQNGFKNINPELIQVDPNNPASERVLKTFEVEKANQYEAGIKTKLFSNRLNATLSYYHITVANKVIGYGTTKIQDGEVKSKGFEIEINATPVDGLNIRAGYSNNSAEITKTETVPMLIGKRLDTAGPDKLYNLWADYEILSGSLKGFGIGFGCNGASENVMSGYPDAGDFTLPKYLVLNESLFYKTSNYKIGLKLNNLTNASYYKGWSTINPQQPRTLLANFTYNF